MTYVSCIRKHVTLVKRQQPLELQMSLREWTFLSNHAHVLVCIARDTDSRVRDIADQVGLTVRAVQRILVELESAGFIEHERVGRRNHYTINLDGQLRHPIEADVSVRHLLKNLVEPKQLRAAATRPSKGK